MKLQIKILIVILGLMPCILNAQVRPRVAGLGENREYMELLEREQELSHKADSLTRDITRLREEFRARPGDRETFASKILQLENEIFDTKNQAGIAASKISEIEEAFIINNLQSGNAAQAGNDPPAVSGNGEQTANLVYNTVFRRLLPENDYAALLKAQLMERPVADALIKYLEGYDSALELGVEYAAAEGSAAADSIYIRYLAVDSTKTEAADSLSRMWRDIYDNKLYAYNYLLQTRNQLRILARLDAAARDGRDEIARQRAGADSEEVVSYFVQKGLIFDYEKTLTGLLGLTAAADSLDRAAGIFELMKRPLPDAKLEERSFIEYEDISVHSPAKYNAGNPIPETAVYQRGLVYRVMLGSYTARQAISVFKGLYPLSYQQEGGKWLYYAGGFAGFGKAKAALEDVKKRGFRNAKIVVWNNGKSLALDEKPAAGGTAYRVEIGGAADGLPADVRRAITDTDGSADISRAGNLFIVGPFATAFEAEEVADAIRKTDASLPVRTTANP